MTTHLQLLKVVVMLCSCVLQANAIPLSQFFSFGRSAGDSVLPRSNGASSPAVQLPEPFRLYGTNYSSAYINANGVVTFQNSSSSSQENYPNSEASIAAFWTPVDLESSTGDEGQVYYRVTDANVHLLNFTNRVSEAFRGSSMEFIGFTASQLLIVTWDRVKGVGVNETNTFQCVLATNFLHSYVFFLYADGMMEWAGEPYALVGFNAGDSVRHLTLPTSQSEAVLGLTTTTNSATSVWIFRTDASDIIQPGAIIGLDQSSYEVSEAEGGVDVCVILYEGVLARDVEVSVISSRRRGTADPLDFTPLTHQVTFTNSEVTGESSHQSCVEFPIVSDDILEIDETFEIHLDLISEGVPVTILPHTTLVTVIDDDLVAIEALSDPQEVFEGKSNVICVDVLGTREVDVSFFYSLSPDTAEDGVDYVTTSGEVVVRPTTNLPCFPVEITDDNIYRNDRRFNYTIGSHDQRVTISRPSGVIEITDNDEESVAVGFEFKTYEVMEGESVKVCVWMTAGLIGQPFTIEVFTAETSTINRKQRAEEGEDFRAENHNITFHPNEPLRTKKCFTLQTYNDSIYEGASELYGLHMSHDYLFTEVNSPARLEIIEDDVIYVSLSQTMYHVKEGNYLQICADLEGEVENVLPFDLDVEAGTAEVSGDLEDINHLTVDDNAIMFYPGSNEACSRIFVLSDSTLEEELEYFSVRLVAAALNPDPERVHLVNSSATVAIEDIDMVRISFLRSELKLEERSATQSVCVFLQGHSSVSIPVQLRYDGGNATDGFDYQLVGGNVTFNTPRNQPGAANCNSLVVRILDDPVVEETENLVIRLHSSEPERIKITHVTSAQTMTIYLMDNDMINVSFVEQLLYVSESAGGVDVCLQMRGFSEISLKAHIRTLPQTAQAGIDFDYQTVELTFPPTNQTVLDDIYQLPVAERFTQAPLYVSEPVCSHVEIIDDDILEETETKLLRLNLTMAGGKVRYEDPSSVLITIVDDDVVTIEVRDTQVEVGEGQGAARVCARMLGRADFPIHAFFTTSSDTALSPGDFTHQAAAEVVFPALSTSPQCVEIPVINDNVLEYRESFFASLSVSSQHNDKVKLGNSSLTEITIIDDDFVNVGFVQADYSVLESDGQVRVCAEMVGALARPVPVSLSTPTQGGTAEAGVDYSPLTDVELFAGLSDLEYRSDCVSITIHNDSVLENTEIIEVALSSSSDDVRFTTLTTNVYVLDDDGVRMGLMARDYAGYEGEKVELCVELDGLFSQDIDLTIQTEQIADSAQADVDYDSFSLPLVFHPRSISHQELCHNLTLREDNVFEDEEHLSILMSVSHPQVSIHIDRANVAIFDNEEVSLSFSSGEMTVPEGVGQVEACVHLQGSTEKEIAYSVDTQPLSASDIVDFSFTRSLFSFPPSLDQSQTHCHSISIVDDGFLEASEDFSVHLSSNVSRVNVITDLIRVTITDDDAVIIGFNETRYLIAEETVGGASVYVCAVLNGRLAENITVAMTTRASSADNNDYTSLNELLTFVPSLESLQTICRTVLIHNDREVEGTEFFTIQLTSEDTRVLLQPSIAEVTISDVDVVCEPEELLSSRGLYLWPQTFPRESAEVRCLQGGMATRFCTLTGSWEKPDVSNCRVSAEKLFKYLMLHPFSEENFSELQYAVELVKLEGKGARSEYMEVVVSYLSQLLEKLEGEDSEQLRLTSDLFEGFLNISDGIQEWQAHVLQPYSSSFVRNIEHLVELFMKSSNMSSFQLGLKHSSLFFEKGNLKSVLPTDKTRTIQFAKEASSENYVLLADDSKATSIKSSITLPPSLHLHLANGTNEVGVFFGMFDTGVMFPIADGNGARINETNISSVISASVLERDVVDLKENITYTIFLDTPAENISGVVCVSWNFDAANGRGNWTDKGCTNLTNGSHGNVTCSCNHLTNFAILMDVRPKPQGSIPLTVVPEFSLNIIAIIGVAVSMLGLLLTIITLLAFKKLRVRDSTVLRIQFCVAVILMLLSFVAGIERVDLFEVCVTISALIHYFTLVSLMWLAAEALLMFQKAIISTNLNYKYFVIVSLVCWLLPIPAVVVPIGLSRDFVTHEEFCFISHNIVFYAAFLGPIAAILTFNLVIFFIVTCVVLRHSAQRYKNTQKHSKRKGIMLTMLNIIAVLLLFGVTWVFGAFMVKGRQEIFEFLFVVSNSLQGFYVFIFFVVLAKETRELWMDTCSCRRKKEEPDSAHMESIPGTPTVSRVPSLRKKRPQFNVDEYGSRLEALTVDTPDTRKRMNSWDIMYVMPQNQFQVLMFSDQLQQHPEHEQEDDFDKEEDDILPSTPKEGGEESTADGDNRSTADSGIMDDKPKSTPSPTMGRSGYVEMTVPPQSGGTPKHSHSVSGIGYVSDDSAEDSPMPVTLKQTKSRDQSHDQSHDIELREPTTEHTLETIETSQV